MAKAAKKGGKPVAPAKQIKRVVKQTQKGSGSDTQPYSSARKGGK
jgi:hypothetical protein